MSEGLVEGYDLVYGRLMVARMMMRRRKNQHELERHIADIK